MIRATGHHDRDDAAVGPTEFMPTLVLRSSRLFAIPWKAAARRPISVVSVVNGKRIHEPTFPLPVYFASLAINLLALAMPLSIMQVYDRIIPNHSLGTL